MRCIIDKSKFEQDTIEIADRIFTVDSSEATLEKINKLKNKKYDNETEVIHSLIRCTMGEDADAYIKEQNYPIKALVEISRIIFCLIKGIDPESDEAKESFRKK